VIAGTVALAVFFAAAAFAWSAFERTEDRVPVDEVTPTTTTTETTGVPIPGASFASLTLEHPPEGAEWPVPTASLVYGDFANPVKAVGTDFVKPFVTTAELPTIWLGLPAGLELRAEGDALSATLEIQEYREPFQGEEAPVAAFDLMRGPGFLPETPGSYWLSVRGEWDDGWATFSSVVYVVEHGTLQFVLEDNGRTGDATAEMWVDGRRVQGTLTDHTLWQADLGVGTRLEPVDFDEYVPIDAAAPILVRGDPTELSGALTGPRWQDASDPGTRFPVFGPEARVPAEPGPHLLVLEIAWQEGQIGWAGSGYREEASFAFPVDIGAGGAVPSSAPPPDGPVEIAFDTSEEGKVPRAFATLGDREYPAVMDRYRFVIDGEEYGSAHSYRDAEMVAAATIRVRPGTVVNFGSGPGRVLAGLGDSEPAPMTSLEVEGRPGQTVTLTFRGEWEADSFVEWEVFFEIVE
jgi:hypothetical protein